MRGREPGEEPVAQRPQPRRLGGLFVEAEFDGPGQADDARHVERAAAEAAFLAAAVDQRLQADARLAAADVKAADALGTVHLVGGETQQIDLERSDVDRHFAHGLGGVAVQQHAAAAAELPDLGQRLDHADLVVGQHDGHEDRVAADRLGQSVDPSSPACGSGACTTGSSVTSKPWRPKPVQRIEHGGVLGGHADDVSSLVDQLFRRAARARLLLSVAPLVKTISFARAPIAAATVSRAASTASLAAGRRRGWRCRRCRKPR